MRYVVTDSQAEKHEFEAAAVELDPPASRVTFYADDAKRQPIASFTGATFAPAPGQTDS